MVAYTEIMDPQTFIANPKGENDGEYIEFRICPTDMPSISIWCSRKQAIELAQVILALTVDDKSTSN